MLANAKTCAPRSAVRAMPKLSPARALRSARCVRVTASAKPQMPQRVEKVAAGVTAATGAMLASPLYAEAASLSPSLKNLIGSVIAGAAVFGGLFGAVYFVSNFDPVTRK